ncbi:MAG: 2-C-methyl-D-erythritol 4-phosphate cytidylyltransferase [Bacteroidales bacterium]|nr:2-C-methyl-D-erythritol 4-phosphate cytidylyltransferase [Candidatus Cryptobacteroides aphodequi]
MLQTNERKVYAIFVAGGHGTRMGGDVPKQFLDLCGQPVLQRTILRFTQAIPGLKVIVVLPREFIPEWKEMCLENNMDVPQTIVAGGLTRFHSVQNALEKVPDGAVVMIHDGVRPLVSADLLSSMLECSRTNPGVIPAVSVTDTLRTRDGSAAPDRSNLLAVQTPQVFHSEAIKQAYRCGYDTSFTDDASVAQKNNIPLTVVEGERYNIKITLPEDLELARLLVSTIR